MMNTINPSLKPLEKRPGAPHLLVAQPGRHVQHEVFRDGQCRQCEGLAKDRAAAAVKATLNIYIYIYVDYTYIYIYLDESTMDKLWINYG